VILSSFDRFFYTSHPHFQGKRFRHTINQVEPKSLNGKIFRGFYFRLEWDFIVLIFSLFHYFVINFTRNLDSALKAFSGLDSLTDEASVRVESEGEHGRSEA